MSQTFYTGTKHKGRLESYRAGVFFTVPNGEIQRDAGDFGAGVYTDRSKFKATLYGRYVFKLEVDMEKILVIGNPYSERDVARNAPSLFNAFYECVQGQGFYPEKWCWYLKTISLEGQERWDASKNITKLALAEGYLGILRKHGRENELVLFSNEPILSFEEVTSSDWVHFEKLDGHAGEAVKVVNPNLKTYGAVGNLIHVTKGASKIEIPFRTLWLKNINLELVEASQ